MEEEAAAPPPSPPPAGEDDASVSTQYSEPPASPWGQDEQQQEQQLQQPLLLRRLSSRVVVAAGPPPPPPPPEAAPPSPSPVRAAKRVRFADQQPRPLPCSPAWWRGCLRVLLSPTERRAARCRLELVLRGRLFLAGIVILTLYVLIGTCPRQFDLVACADRRPHQPTN